MSQEEYNLRARLREHQLHLERRCDKLERRCKKLERRTSANDFARCLLAFAFAFIGILILGLIATVGGGPFLEALKGLL